MTKKNKECKERGYHSFDTTVSFENDNYENAEALVVCDDCGAECRATARKIDRLR